MDFEKEIKKCQEIMILRGFTAQSKKTYLYNVKKYLNFLIIIRLNPDKNSAKEYLLYLYA